MKRSIVVSMLAFLLVFSLGLMARDGHREVRMGNRGEMLFKALDRLDLSAEQQEQIKALNKKHMIDKFDHKYAIEKQKRQMKKLFLSDSATKDDVYDMIDKSVAAHTLLKKQSIDYMLDIRAILTDEQIKKIEELKSDRSEKYRGNRDGMRGNRQARGSERMHQGHERSGISGFKPMMNKGAGMMLGKAIKHLDLTEEQMDKIHAIRKKHMLEKFDDKDSIKDIMRSINDLKESGTVDRAKYYKVIDEGADAVKERMKAGYDHIQEIKTVLTPEQIQKLGEMKEKVRDRFKGKRTR